MSNIGLYAAYCLCGSVVHRFDGFSH